MNAGRHLRALRPALTALTAAVTLALLLSFTAPAAHAAAPAVRDRHLPTWAEIDALYDGFENGTRGTGTQRGTFVLERNCLTYDDGPTAPKGRFADYYGAFGSIPVHAGYEQPSVLIQSFSTAKAAQKAWTAQRAWIDHCDGKAVEDRIGDTSEFDRIPLRGLGDKRVALRWDRMTPITGDDPWYSSTLDLWVRDGKHLVNIHVRQDVEGAVPSKPKAVALARLTLNRLP
jgi:hypothetical protein